MAVKACFSRHLSPFFHKEGGSSHSTLSRTPVGTPLRYSWYSTGGDGKRFHFCAPSCESLVLDSASAGFWDFFPTNLTPSFALGIAGRCGLISYPDAVRERSERAASSPCHAHLYISSLHICVSLSLRFLAPALSSPSSEQRGEVKPPHQHVSEVKRIQT